MSRNRLPYETKGGNISEGETFAQLLEFLRMAEEAAYTIGHIRSSTDDHLGEKGWLAIGEMLKLTQHNVTQLATKRLRTSKGFN